MFYIVGAFGVSNHSTSDINIPNLSTDNTGTANRISLCFYVHHCWIGVLLSICALQAGSTRNG